MKALGIDPGFSKLGWSSVAFENGVYTFNDMGVIKTARIPKKQRHNVRMTDDDARRIMEITEELSPLFLLHGPDVLGIETFSIRPGKGTGWKAAFGYAVALSLSRLYDVPILCYTPGDVKAFVNDKTASKDKVRSFITENYFPSINWEETNIGDREHLGDSLALAVLAVKQYAEYRRKFS